VEWNQLASSWVDRESKMGTRLDRSTSRVPFISPARGSPVSARSAPSRRPIALAGLNVLGRPWRGIVRGRPVRPRSREWTPITPGFRHAAPALCTALILASGGPSQPLADPPPLLKPDAPEWTARAPDRFDVRLDTSRGIIRIEVRRDWAPHGVDRFYHLARAGF
jgi:hypothetical protein